VVVGQPPRAQPYGLIDVKYADPDGNWLTVSQEA
jgi:hypothetical protein